MGYGRGAALGSLHKESRLQYQQEFQKFSPKRPGAKDINQEVREEFKMRAATNRLKSQIAMTDPTPGGRDLGEPGKDLCYGRGLFLGSLHNESRKQYQQEFQKFSPRSRSGCVNHQVLDHWKQRCKEQKEKTGYEFAKEIPPAVQPKERVVPHTVALECPPSPESPGSPSRASQAMRTRTTVNMSEMLQQKRRGGRPPPVASLDELKSVLIRRFGNVVRGWRVGIDTNGDGALTMAEFCAACRAVGIEGQFRTIFRKCDEDGSQTITLEEFDAEAFHILNDFKELLSKKFLTIEAAWESVAKDSPGGITADQFHAATKRIGWEGDSKKLLQYLDMETFGGGRITMDELEFLKLPSKADFEPPKKYEKATITLERGKREPVETLAQLKEVLRRRYGNLVTGWRVGIDSDGDGKLTMAEFVKACRKIGIEGNFKSMFREMDNDGSQSISLKEFDPHAAQVFDDFKNCLQEKYGTLQKAWNLGLARDSPGGLSKDKFIAGCAKVGYQGDAKELVKFLDTDIFGTGRITMDELEFLGIPQELDTFQVVNLF
jgi:hypothetical protein